MNQPLISFHGKQEIKDAKIADLLKHQELDSIAQGSYWREDVKKGCAVTCTMFTPEDFKLGNIDEIAIHKRYETALGIPQILARLEDRIFEGLPVAESKNWPLNFIQAVPVGVDLKNVWRKFMIFLLIDDAAGVVKFAKTDAQRKAITDIAEAFETSLTTTVSRDKWNALRNVALAERRKSAAAAAAAAYAAAAADAYAAAAAAAYAAAAAAAAAAAYAADADADAARRSHYVRLSEKLIELLKEVA